MSPPTTPRIAPAIELWTRLEQLAVVGEVENLVGHEHDGGVVRAAATVDQTDHGCLLVEVHFADGRFDRTGSCGQVVADELQLRWGHAPPVGEIVRAWLEAAGGRWREASGVVARGWIEAVAGAAVDPHSHPGELALPAEHGVLGEVLFVVERTGWGVTSVVPDRRTFGDDRRDGGAAKLPAEPQGAIATHGPAEKCDSSGVQTVIGQQRNELGQHHRAGVVAAASVMPVAVIAAVYAGDRERLAALSDGLGEEPVQPEVAEGAAVIAAAAV